MKTGNTSSTGINPLLTRTRTYGDPKPGPLVPGLADMMRLQPETVCECGLLLVWLPAVRDWRHILACTGCWNPATGYLPDAEHLHRPSAVCEQPVPELCEHYRCIAPHSFDQPCAQMHTFCCGCCQH